jgi:hypothetical protein
MATRFSITVDTKPLDALTDALGRISQPDFVEKAAIAAVNKVTDRTYDLARRRMNAGINLDDQYIARKLKVEHASKTPRATITAAGDLTVLGRYDPKIILKPVKHPGRSKGDASRGIPPGLKSGGVTVQVGRGAVKPIAHGFLMPLRRGSDAGANGIGVFTRDANGRVRHRYGPAVYQLFRATTENILGEVQDDLQATVNAALDTAINKALDL